MEIHTAWITTATPSSFDDPGAAELCHYTVEDDFVQLVSEDGKPKSNRVKLNGDDPRRVAGRLMHQALATKEKELGFNRPLPPPLRTWR